MKTLVKALMAKAKPVAAATLTLRLQLFREWGEAHSKIGDWALALIGGPGNGPISRDTSDRI